MINVKDMVYSALSGVIDNVTDSYPSDWATLPAVQYVEEENKPHTVTDDTEQISYIRYKIDIWDTKSTSQTACDIDDVMSKLGFLRTTCQDVPESSQFKHKLMRYEALIDCKKEYIFFPDGYL